MQQWDKTEWPRKAPDGRLVEALVRARGLTQPHGGWSTVSAGRGDRPEHWDQGRQDRLPVAGRGSHPPAAFGSDRKDREGSNVRVNSRLGIVLCFVLLLARACAWQRGECDGWPER